MTALTIAIADPVSWAEARAGEDIGGVTITSDASDASETVLDLLTVAVLLFAFSTILTWGYYGLKAWSYLFGKSRTSEITFRAVWSLFVVAGTSSGAALRRPP
jgi:alanine or glycine:cation symporter, AGCS family